MTRKILAAACGAVAVAALAPSAASAATHTVFVGGDGVVKNAPAQFSPNAFLRKTITIHVGDTVRWRFRGFHTVTVPVRGKPAPPFALPSATQKVANVLDPAGQPFWFNGVLPTLALNPRVAAPTKGKTYNGKGFRNSGLPSGNNPQYRLRFTKAGTFTYFCAIHPGMEGHVRVVRSSRRIPTARQNAHAATRELNALARQARRAAAKPAKGPLIVDVGRAPRGQRFTINAFFPSTINVKVGQTVQFTMAGENTTEIHTITLGPLTRAQVPFVDNQGNINPEAAYPSDLPTAFPPYNGKNHGVGFLNLGLHDNNPATPPDLIGPTGAISFAAAGTFHLQCLVHEGMDATVNVTP